MIEYMQHCPEGTLIYHNHGKQIIKHSMPWIIEQWCLRHLFSYAGYLKAVKQNFGYSYGVPLYLCDEMMLIPVGRIRDYEMMWINQASIKCVYTENRRFYIHFISESILEVNMTQTHYEIMVKKLGKIRNTKVKHFH